MDKLPHEAFILIISKLNLINKQECTLLCKKWYETVTTSILYSNLTFCRHDESSHHTNNFVKAFTFFNKERAEQLGKQVNSLQFSSYWKVDLYSFLSLPRLFPNLKTLYWSDGSGHEEVLNGKTIPSKEIYVPQFSKWIDLKTLYISAFTALLPRMTIGSAIFDRLTTLAVAFYKFNDAQFGERSTCSKSFFQEVANLPALKVLELEYVNADLEDMEKLHSGAPNLEKIELVSIRLMDTQNTLTIARAGSNLLTLREDHLVGVSGICTL